jgi:hypothetical protein
VRTIDQAGETTSLVVGDPRVDALARDPVTFSNLGDGEAITRDLEDGGISLFDHAELHEHCPGPPPRRYAEGACSRARLSSISRSHVKDQPKCTSSIS